MSLFADTLDKFKLSGGVITILGGLYMFALAVFCGLLIWCNHKNKDDTR